jgi:hypothetical protein
VWNEECMQREEKKLCRSVTKTALQVKYYYKNWVKGKVNNNNNNNNNNNSNNKEPG